MTIENQIAYEKEVLKHLTELDCPEYRLTKEILEHPEYSQTLLEEAKRYFTSEKNY